jgi:hypothetical protein
MPPHLCMQPENIADPLPVNRAAMDASAAAYSHSHWFAETQRRIAK